MREENLGTTWRRARELSNDFHVLLRIGCGLLLLFFDVFLLGIVLWDLATLASLDLEIYNVSFISNILKNFSPYYLSMAGLLVFLPPLVAAITYFIFRNVKPVRHARSKNSQNILYLFHCFVAIAFSFFISISDELAELSGSRGVITSDNMLSFSSFDYTPLYTSLFYWVLPAIPVAIAGARLLAFLSLPADISRNTSPRKYSLIKEFTLWFQLADVSKDFFPEQSSHLVFANTASMAPAIRWILKREHENRNIYQKKVPTSDQAKNFLKEKAEQSRAFLQHHLVANISDPGKYSIEFFPGTSRALEVGLTQIENLSRIIVSPYEHPGQFNVTEWHATIKPSVVCERIILDPMKLLLSWNEQKTWLVSEIKKRISNQDEGKTAILVSEVHYMTGLQLRIREVINEIRPNHRGSSVVFIIDGTQAVGNIPQALSPFIDCIQNEDFYYFSAHKWLLSPNTCGVLIAQRDRNPYARLPYDVFGAEPPSATIDPGTIFGIHASLEFLMTEDRLKLFQQKTDFLKSYFIDHLSDGLEIVQSITPNSYQSNFLAIRPAPGSSWRYETIELFWEQLRKAGIDLTLIDPMENNSESWWLRISFPYFMQLHALRKLTKHVNQLIKTTD